MSEWRILVVDDEPGVLHGIKRILSSKYDVVVTESATDALSMTRTAPADLAIIDVRMPQMDGFELMDRMKSIHERTDVIIMTGSVDDTDEKLVKAISGDAFYFLTKPFDRGVLLALVDRCLERKRLQLAEQAHTELLRRQLMSAFAFQKSMLPSDEATVEGFNIRAAYYPCEHVAGDFYDYAASGEGCVTLLIADVVGHGASAAMLTALVKSAFHKSRKQSYDPLAVVSNISDDMSAFESDQFLTLFCAQLSESARTIDYVNAGHLEGLLIGHDGSILTLEPNCPLVSPIVSGNSWKKETVEWPSDSRLLMYTDGVTEAWRDDEMFGPSRLHQIVRDSYGDGDHLVDAIFDGVNSHLGGNEPTDDLTLLYAWRDAGE